MSSGPIAIGIFSKGSYPLLFEVITQCLVRKEKVLLIYGGTDVNFYQTILKDADRLGTDVCSFEEAVETAMAEGPPLIERIRKFLRNIVKGGRGASNPVDKFEIYRENHALRLRVARRMLKSKKPKAMITTDDGISANMWLITAARKIGIPLIDCPYDFGSREGFDTSLAWKERDGVLEMAVGEYGEKVIELYPQWVKTGRYAGALMYPSEDILARESLGITLWDAWIIHGGFSDRLCAESRHMCEFYEHIGIPADKITLTGSPYCDIIHRVLENSPEERAAWMSGKKISGGKTRIVVSWPTSYHADRADKCEFDTYKELSSRVLQYLAALPDVELIVSLHPDTTDTDRAEIKELGIEVTEENVVELIPICDIFVACFSGTTRWAIAAGKPVVNYNFYHFALPIYDDAPGVLKVTAFSAFQDTVSRLCLDEDYYAEVAQLQLNEAEKWGKIDGRGFDRIYEVIQELTK